MEVETATIVSPLVTCYHPSIQCPYKPSHPAVIKNQEQSSSSSSMAIFSRSKTLILTLFLISILTTLSAKSVINGDIRDILPIYGLPPDLFPNVPNAASIESNGEMTLDLSTRCRIPVKSSRLISISLYYDKNITGIISYGRIESVTGIRYAALNLPSTPVISIEVKVDGDPPKTQIMFNTESLGSPLFDWDFFNPIPECLPWINVEVS